MQQLANLWNNQQRAMYFRARYLWAVVQQARRRPGTMVERYAASPTPFPEFNTIAPEHLNNAVPTYMGPSITGDTWRDKAVVIVNVMLDWSLACWCLPFAVCCKLY